MPKPNKLDKPTLNTILILDKEISVANEAKFDSLNAISTALNTKDGKRIQTMANKALELPLSFPSRSKDSSDQDSNFIPRAKKSISKKWKDNTLLKPDSTFKPAVIADHPIEIPSFDYKFITKFDLKLL